jgi:hypothetical protein
MIMNWLKKIRSFAVLVFVFGFLFSASLSSCESKGNETGNTENTAEVGAEKSEHPEGESEHPEGEEGQEHPQSNKDSVEHQN